jgi:hypothetical protein
MDISNNYQNLEDAVYEYQRNIRHYMDNIHEYNQNISTYLNMISRGHPSYRSIPIPTANPTTINNIFQNLNQRRNLFRHNFEDVVVRPTEAQITRALENFSYLQLGEPHICPITLENIQEGEEVTRIRHCGHIFKRSAIEGWFLRNVRCPVCRYDIRDYNPNISEARDTSGNDVSQSNDSTEFDDLIHEFAEEGRSFINRTPLSNFFGSTPLASTMTNAIRTFINNELQRMPVNDTTTELLYSFDIPLTLDASGNYRL